MRNSHLALLFVLFTGTTKLEAQTKTRLNRTVADTNVILPPAWAFGILYGGYTNQQETIERIEQIKKHDYPIDAYWIDSWFWSYNDKGKGPAKYIDFVADTVSYPNRKAMWSYLQKNNIKGGFWIWDCILETGNEKAFNDFKSKGFFSSVYLNTNSWHNGSRSTAMFQNGKEEKGTQCGNIDFTNPAAVGYFKQKMKAFFGEGADFIKLDRTSNISTCKAMFEMSQQFGKETKGRGFLLSHSFDTENEEYKRYPTKWTDDTRSDWTVEKPVIGFNDWVPNVAFKENITMFTNPANKTSSIPFLTNDMGGFDMGKTAMPDEELFIRWMQFSMFNSITEVFSQPENPTANLAWKYSKRADTLFWNYAHLRMQLFPYIYSYALRSRIEGRHMIGKFPEHNYQYSFGDEMLLAPVYEKNADEQTVFLPDGKWVNYWTGETKEGNQLISVAAPLEQVPLFVKAGSVIPMRSYASAVEEGNNSMLTLHVYPGADGSFTLLEDDGISNDYLKNIYASTKITQKVNGENLVITINPVEGYYRKIENRRDWILVIHTDNVCRSVTINGKKKDAEINQHRSSIVIKTGRQSINRKLAIAVSFSAQVK
ncbi:MAG TPA: glycoside hydrolase family 31 protein [Chitinophagaceae bacterium]|jgi:alpha-glucosidase (family GH31 glycosyl hydrolase)|nr:glycoside hydrolase family 31 protein [Chitinophagaceae bacterium]HMU58929.1 glycoside hydrolase family 31 protein [Chitinophagaceae bacterium]